MKKISQKTVTYLKKIACQIRKETLKSICAAGTGHSGGSLSVIDILTTLYFHVLKHNPKMPLWDKRDRFILSKGHACPALYATLAEAGYFHKKELAKLRHINSLLQGHPEYGIPGIETPSGSLGQGISAAVGMAIGFKYQKQNNQVYVITGDGESQEGQVWEAAMAAGFYGLDNLTAFLDYNKLQGDGPVKSIMDLEPLAAKWKAFNWAVKEIDGNDIKEILQAIAWAHKTKGKPQMIICHTTKGKGVSYMENVISWHGTKPPTPEQLEQAITELNSIEQDICK
jgi:transketolase